jgi:hypothetical protein
MFISRVNLLAFAELTESYVRLQTGIILPKPQTTALQVQCPPSNRDIVRHVRHCPPR